MGRNFEFEEEWARAVWADTQAARSAHERLLAMALEFARNAPLADRHRFIEFANMVERDFTDIFDPAEEAILTALRNNNFVEAMQQVRELGMKAMARGQAALARRGQGER